MNKIINHQIAFIFFSELLILYIFLSKENFIDYFNVNPVIMLSFILIGSIGVSHGAMDGKVIWQSSKNFSIRLRILIIYLSLILIGLMIWYVLPLLGLFLLIFMSVFHFAESDLFFANDLNLFAKLSWGLSVTLLPIVFHPAEVIDIFNLLTQSNLPLHFASFISVLILLSSIFYICVSIVNLKNRSEIMLSIFELLTLILLATFVHPVTWFAIYFCGLHGIRALIRNNFKLKNDVFWLAGFTIPVIIFLLYFLQNNHFNLPNNMLIIFPTLASLTIAHMCLKKILLIVKNY